PVPEADRPGAGRLAPAAAQAGPPGAAETAGAAGELYRGPVRPGAAAAALPRDQRRARSEQGRSPGRTGKGGSAMDALPQEAVSRFFPVVPRAGVRGVVAAAGFVLLFATLNAGCVNTEWSAAKSTAPPPVKGTVCQVVATWNNQVVYTQ